MMTPEQAYWLGVIATISIALLAFSILRSPNMNSRQLRHMSATVYARTFDNREIYILKSYETIVAAYYPIANAIYLGAKYDCSQTTMKHVRAFFSDYASITVSIPDLRKQIVRMRFDGEYRCIDLDGVELNAYTCSQSQLTDMLWRSQN